MKTTILVTTVITGLFLGARAEGAGAVGGAPAAHAAPVAPVAPVAGGTVRTTPPTSPSDINPIQPPIGTAQTSTTTTPSSPAGTAGNPTEGANNVNQTGNGTANQPNSNPLLGNQAVTANDRILLNTLSQSVGAQLGAAPQTTLPVRFLINNGTVTLVGTVPTADESQRIQSRVQQTPGVLSVFNDLQVGTPSANAQAQTSFFGATTDHAFSPADQSLLSGVQQAAGTQLGINGASTMQLPVHFSIQNGVVGVNGQVSSIQEKQALLAAIQQVQGVSRVVDNVQVTGTADNSTTQNPFMNNGNLPATSRNMGQTNSLFNTATNSGF